MALYTKRKETDVLAYVMIQKITCMCAKNARMSYGQANYVQLKNMRGQDEIQGFYKCGRNDNLENTDQESL